MSVMENNKTSVFVYGTLLKGEPNHRLLTGNDFVGEARTEASFELVSLGAYPAMVPGGNTPVEGEVYEVDEETLERLDRLEGHPHFYLRQRVRLEDGAEVQAYLLDRAKSVGYPAIESGSWRREIEEGTS